MSDGEVRSGGSTEMRQVISDRITTKAPILQYRVRVFKYDGGGHPIPMWSEWMNIPCVVMNPTEYFKATGEQP